MCCDKKICANIGYGLAPIFLVAGPIFCIYGLEIFDWDTYIILLVALLIVPVVGFIMCMLLAYREEMWNNSFGVCCGPYDLSRLRERGPPLIEDGKTLCYICNMKVLSEDWESHRNRCATLCYLCHAPVTSENWNEHRNECAIQNQEKLNRLTTANKECPRCGKIMKFCEEDGVWFYCSNNRRCYHGGRPILNHSRLTRVVCYHCDISFCNSYCLQDLQDLRTPASAPLQDLSTPASAPLQDLSTPASAPLLEDVPWIPTAPPPEDPNPSDSFPGQENGHAELPTYEEAVLMDWD